ncbi:MAG: L-aspartate oxidase [Actinomycetota bacterium]
MATAHDFRVVRCDQPIIVGSGIAGLSVALGLEASVVMTSGEIGRGSSDLAQGGMAAAIGMSDRPDLHASDTVAVGGDIVDGSIAELVAHGAPSRIDWLADLGAVFDLAPDGSFSLGREAGHSRRRIVHAGGDATGAEIMRALRDAASRRSDIEFLAGTTLVDLVRSADRIVGVLASSLDGEMTVYLAPAVVLATGGIGGVFERSTNPGDVQGTGLAAAARQGAVLADLEFVQFHPTALAAVDHPAPLVTEALRGEGAHLVDETGARFMVGVHRDAELAPRDIVARTVWSHEASGHRVYLDTPSAIGDAMPSRFPTVFAAAREIGVDARTQLLEVRPAAHYHMGGIKTDSAGRTSIPGLWAVGEVAATGLHGANRLASNSLLEAVVMGRRASIDVTDARTHGSDQTLLVPADAVSRQTTATPDLVREVQRISWNHVGISRNEDGLRKALRGLDACGANRTDAGTVVGLIASAALARRESRGAHFRADHPEPDSERASSASVVPTSARMAEMADQLVRA